MSETEPALERQVGVLHPGQMGVAVAAALAAGGAAVRWAGRDRSAATRARAEAVGIEDAGSLEALAAQSEVLVSVCPPHAAEALANEVAACGFAGTYVDANAVSPRTVRAIGEVLGGASFVDGAIIGPPPQRAGTTRLYLSGPAAAEVATLFAGTVLDAQPLAGEAGAASALKVCFASWTKGTSALLIAIRALARAEGVERALLDEWAQSWPELEQRSARQGAASASKAWRFVAEMREIGAAMRAHGLPDGFGDAPAELYERLTPLKDRACTLDEALDLLAPRPHDDGTGA